MVLERLAAVLGACKTTSDQSKIRCKSYSGLFEQAVKLPWLYKDICTDV